MPTSPPVPPVPPSPPPPVAGCMTGLLVATSEVTFPEVVSVGNARCVYMPAWCCGGAAGIDQSEDCDGLCESGLMPCTWPSTIFAVVAAVTYSTDLNGTCDCVLQVGQILVFNFGILPGSFDTPGWVCYVPNCIGTVSALTVSCQYFGSTTYTDTNNDGTPGTPGWYQAGANAAPTYTGGPTTLAFTVTVQFGGLAGGTPIFAPFCTPPLWPVYVTLNFTGTPPTSTNLSGSNAGTGPCAIGYWMELLDVVVPEDLAYFGSGSGTCAEDCATPGTVGVNATTGAGFIGTVSQLQTLTVVDGAAFNSVTTLNPTGCCGLQAGTQTGGSGAGGGCNAPTNGQSAVLTIAPGDSLGSLWDVEGGDNGVVFVGTGGSYYTVSYNPTTGGYILCFNRGGSPCFGEASIDCGPPVVVAFTNGMTITT